MKRTGVAALMLLAATAVGAQQYPNKPIRMIVPYAPGGGSDIVARIVGQRMTEAMGQTVVVDNRPGAAGMLGTGLTTLAPPDGYTLLLADTSFTINVAYFRKPSYDTKQFAPVAQIADTPYVLIAHPSVPANNVKEFIALAKAQPGKINLGSSGNGSGSHIAGELFQLETGTQLNHIPYKGSGPSTADTLAGQIQASFATAPGAVPYYKAGRLKILAAASPNRSGALPDVPTFAELGYKNVVVTNWYGVIALAGTPAAVMERLHAEVARATKLPDVRERLAAVALDPVEATTEQFRELVDAELKRWSKVIADAKIQRE
jgi:tripartite-type tricarboxylate transporter receptor subunit TctC